MLRPLETPATAFRGCLGLRPHYPQVARQELQYQAHTQHPELQLWPSADAEMKQQIAVRCQKLAVRLIHTHHRRV